MSGLTRRATRAVRPRAAAAASMRSISRSDSALKARIAGFDAEPELLVRLADAGEDDLRGRKPALEARPELASRNDVRPGAERGETPEDREARVGLGGVADEVRDRREGGVVTAGGLVDPGRAVDVERRPVLAGEVRERHAVARETRRFAARSPPRWRTIADALRRVPDNASGTRRCRCERVELDHGAAFRRGEEPSEIGHRREGIQLDFARRFSEPAAVRRPHRAFPLRDRESRPRSSPCKARLNRPATASPRSCVAGTRSENVRSICPSERQDADLAAMDRGHRDAVAGQKAVRSKRRDRARRV